MGECRILLYLVEQKLTIITHDDRFNSGAYVCLVSNPIMEMGSVSDIGRRTGMCMSILALGALAGPPIAGAINTATGGFKAVGYYAGRFRNHTMNDVRCLFCELIKSSLLFLLNVGSAVLLGVVMICISRHLVLGQLYGRL
jgi:MCP family monocarboxylic acid transporter-like MFS transporter 10